MSLCWWGGGRGWFIWGGLLNGEGILGRGDVGAEEDGPDELSERVGGVGEGDAGTGNSPISSVGDGGGGEPSCSATVGRGVGERGSGRRRRPVWGKG